MRINTNKRLIEKLELLFDQVKHDFHKSNKTVKEYEHKEKLKEILVLMITILIKI